MIILLNSNRVFSTNIHIFHSFKYFMSNYVDVDVCFDAISNHYFNEIFKLLLFEDNGKSLTNDWLKIYPEVNGRKFYLICILSNFIIPRRLASMSRNISFINLSIYFHSMRQKCPYLKIYWSFILSNMSQLINDNQIM